MRIEHPFRSIFELVVHKAPIEAQIVVTRRCNLSCGYCSEYDQHSPEVPYDVLTTRIDAIHRLRAQNIALLGGEPLMHSRIDELVRYAARHAQVSLTTNGFMLDRSMIERLGDARLANLQISIDGLKPDRTGFIQKTLRSLAPKLDRLAAHARFVVHVTVVLCRETVADFEELYRELERYPFRVSVNLVHDDHGQISVSGPEFVRAWKRHFDHGRPLAFIEQEYGERLLSGERPDWICRAGGRFLYVDEDGNVELCSGQRGRVGKLITEYGAEDLARQRKTVKGCERGCSILCVYRASQIDNDPVALVAAVVRGLGAGAFVKKSPGEPPAPGGGEPPRRHLPLAAA